MTLLKIKQFLNELYDYEFTGEVKIEKREDEEEISTMVIDEDQDSVGEKTEEKMEYVSLKLVTRRK